MGQKLQKNVTYKKIESYVRRHLNVYWVLDENSYGFFQRFQLIGEIISVGKNHYWNTTFRLI